MRKPKLIIILGESSFKNENKSHIRKDWPAKKKKYKYEGSGKSQNQYQEGTKP